ncbi:MAG: AAA family ATPase, partial [Candidatus Nanohaloarchaea archaeon]
VAATRDRDELSYGASPRGSLNLVLAAKAHALVEGRTHVSNEDVDAMANPVLRHRIGLSFQAEREGLEPDDVIDRIVGEV